MFHPTKPHDLMKRFYLKYLLLALISFTGAQNSLMAEEFHVEKIYQKKLLPSNSKVVDSSGIIRDAEYILVPVTLDNGSYSIQVIREQSDLFNITGTDLYISISRAWGMSYHFKQDAILVIKSTYGYNVGTLITVDN